MTSVRPERGAQGSHDEDDDGGGLGLADVSIKHLIRPDVESSKRKDIPVVPPVVILSEELLEVEVEPGDGNRMIASTTTAATPMAIAMITRGFIFCE